MSNIKSVQITGRLPFDLSGIDDLLKFLGQCNLPSSGLTFKFNSETDHYLKMDNTGQYAFYNFSIFGEDSISYEYIKHIFLTLTYIGWIERFKVTDVENNEVITDVKNSISWEDFELSYYHNYPKYPEKTSNVSFFVNGY